MNSPPANRKHPTHARRGLLLAGTIGGLVLFGAMGVGWLGSPAVADADLASGVVVDQHVFDVGASWRGYEDRMQQVDEATAECMTAKGHNYEPPERTTDERAVAAFRDPSGPELEFAEQWGFGLTTVQDFGVTMPDGEAAATVAQDHSEAYQRALHGSDTSTDGGCHMQGMAAMKATSESYFQLSDSVETALSQFATHPAVAEHYANWSACMAARGHDFVSPVEAAETIKRDVIDAMKADRNRAVVEDIRPREITLATATVECGGPARNLLDEDLSAVWVTVARNVGL